LTKLQRTTFETSRAAEYFDARQLSTLVGVSQGEFASVCLKELVDNSLDASETAGVPPVVGVKVEREDGLIRLSVSDNGPGIPAEVVGKVLDYNVRVSDKAAYRSPTRGAQGNALKTVVGIPYALGSREPITIESQGVSHRIKPWVDPAGAVHFDYVSAEMLLGVREPGTTVSLEMPNGLGGEAATVAEINGFSNDHVAQDFDPLHWVRSFAAFNPHATLSYQVKAMVQKRPKFTNRPTRAPSRSTCRASRQARIGTATALSRCWSFPTLATPAKGAVTYPSVSSSGSSRG
jgi:DNA topoisomerase VI subunit B